MFRHYTDAGAPLETETPSIIWNEQNHEFIMLFQSAASVYGEAQSSFRLTSADGITWTNCEKLFDIDGTRIPGNLHNGYVIHATELMETQSLEIMNAMYTGQSADWA